jgi:hypothetical protein
MKVQARIRYSLTDVLRELGQDEPAPDRDGIMLSTMHDKFFKGGGCESSLTNVDGAADGTMIPLNIAVCMRAKP